MFENRYDIVAKAPDNTPKEQLPLMLKTLLIDRFKPVLHQETRICHLTRSLEGAKSLS